MNTSSEHTEAVRIRALKQVEYYFSDENLVRGKFLQKEIEKSADGWVHLNILVKFNRLADICNDSKLLGKLLKKSDSHVIEVSADKQRVRRIGNKPFQRKSTEKIAQLVYRSAYVECIPQNLEISDLISFFEQFSAKHVIIRKFFDKMSKTYKSKGSAFVTFATREQCDEFLQKSIVLNDCPLITMHQEIFNEKKLAEKVKKKANRKMKR